MQYQLNALGDPLIITTTTVGSHDAEQLPPADELKGELELEQESELRASYVKSKYGTNQLSFMNHVFNKHITRDDITYWRCSQFAVLRCRARLKTKGDHKLIILNDEHNHEVITKQRKYGSLKKLKRKAQAEAEAEAEAIKNEPANNI